jgi:A/G-specific adenine glycosylase
MIKEVHRKILSWYEAEKRDLPWRRSLDPYRIWISEIMLQQTRVETVIPYYERFLSHFPTVQALAEADTDQLLNLWAGLGYYSRARNLQAAAREIMTRFGGKLPESLEDLRSLKGIGAYTAAAIASIAYGQPHAAVDGNLERVFARLLALETNPKTKGKAEIPAFGAGLVALGQAGDLNQAFMDLSSRICLPRDPKCDSCPLSAKCLARKLGKQREIPKKKVRKPPQELHAEGIILLAKGELLLARRKEGDWLSGLWDIPWWIQGKETPSLPRHCAQFASCAQTRTITKHKIFFQVKGFQCESKPGDAELRSLPGSDFRWVPLEDLHGINLPHPSERALEETLSRLKSEMEVV